MTDRTVCQKARRLISLALDGRLDARRSNRLDEHLQACPDCRMYRAVQEEIRESISPTSQDEVDDGLAARVRRTLFDSALQGARTARLKKWRQVVAAAAAVLILLTGYGVGRLHPAASDSRPSPMEDDALSSSPSPTPNESPLERQLVPDLSTNARGLLTQLDVLPEVDARLAGLMQEEGVTLDSSVLLAPLRQSREASGSRRLRLVLEEEGPGLSYRVEVTRDGTGSSVRVARSDWR